MNKVQQDLSSADVTSICDAAKKAWDNASNTTKIVKFTWKNRKFKSRLTNFRMLIETLKGEPVACRYH
jgi:hypothetical protein